MARNYYLILGIRPDASLEEIREAYRRLARTTHPDVSGADSAERFREVQEAWKTLGDAERRRTYDAALRAQRPGRSVRPNSRPPTQAPGGHADREGAPEPVVEFGPGGRIRRLHFGLQMSEDDAANGGELPIRFPIRHTCPGCAGFGVRLWGPCLACGGEGWASYWRTVPVWIPAGLRDGDVLELSLDAFGLAGARLELHVEVVFP
jgi:molecular chaperone DnaJ